MRIHTHNESEKQTVFLPTNYIPKLWYVNTMFSSMTMKFLPRACDVCTEYPAVTGEKSDTVLCSWAGNGDIQPVLVAYFEGDPGEHATHATAGNVMAGGLPGDGMIGNLSGDVMVRYVPGNVMVLCLPGNVMVGYVPVSVMVL